MSLHNCKAGHCLVLLMLSVIALAACDQSSPDPVSPTPHASGSRSVALTLDPTTATLRLGENLTINAILNGTASVGVAFRTFSPVLNVINTAPFSVTVRSVHVGNGVIQAYPVNDSSEQWPRATISVTPPSFVLDAILEEATNGPVNSSTVSGAVNFRLIISNTPIADSLRVTARAGTDTLRTWQCGSPRNNGTDRVSILCPIDINGSDAHGQPLFPDGPHTLRARLITPAGGEAATITHPFVVSRPKHRSVSNK